MRPKYDLDDKMQTIAREAYGMSMNAIWRLIDDKLDFVSRRECFLKVLGIFLDKGIVKLGRKGKILDGGEKDLLQQFESSWPIEADFDDDQFSTVVPYRVEGKKNLRTHYWTPGDLVWIDDQGRELWSTDAEV